MRVCHAIANIDPLKGGPSSAVVSIVEALDHCGADVQVALTDHGCDIPGWEDLHGRLHHHASEVSVSRAWDGRWYTSPEMWGELRSLIRRADIVHVHSLYLFHTLAASRLALSHDTPYLVRPHGTLTRHHRARHRMRKALYRLIVENKTLAGAALFHCTSDREERELLEVLPNARTAVVPLPVHVVALPRRKESDDSFRVLFLGRVAPKKRVDLVLGAVEILAKRGVRIQVSVAGPIDPRSRPGIEVAARHAVSAGAQVSILGAVTGLRKWRLYANADAFVLPSLEENFGVSVVEAMMCGVPTVATTGVAIAGELGDIGALELVDSSAESVAARLLALRDDRSRADAVAHRGRTVATERYSPAAVGEQLLSMYETAIV